MTTWILVANRAVAKLFELQGRQRKFTLLEQIEHPEGRLHEGDLVTDSGAAVFQSAGNGQQRTTSSEVSASEQEARQFASELAGRLRTGRVDGRYEHLVLVCAPAFLGELRSEMDAATGDLISREIDKNLAEQSDAELEEALASLLLT